MAKQLIAVRTVAIGTPYFIHCRKSMGMPLFSKIPTAIALGGVPIMVPIPPVVAAMAIPKSKALVVPDSFPNDFKSGRTAAITMAVVAVLLINIDATIVVSINPISKFTGLAPENFIVNLKSASSSLVLVIAAARKNPPNINQITLLEKVCTYLSIFSGSELK